MEDFEQSALWKTAFADKEDGCDHLRNIIVVAYRGFRARVDLLLQQIRAELPALTLHDITHVDALWRVASEIAGPDFPLNPAEALVLGGAILTHDTAHIDAQRAPRQLLVMNQPQGISREHWRFQARLHQPCCDQKRSDLVFTGSPFPSDEQDAWWLAYEAACLADRELCAVDRLLLDYDRQRLSAREVAGVRTPEAFSRHVPTEGWDAVDASLRIGDIKSIVEKFGGVTIYRRKPVGS